MDGVGSWQILIILIFNVGFGVLCGWLAARKNRNPVGWGILGALTTFIGLIIIALIKPKD